MTPAAVLHVDRPCHECRQLVLSSKCSYIRLARANLQGTVHHHEGDSLACALPTSGTWPSCR